jgi:hypothetical protein
LATFVELDHLVESRVDWGGERRRAENRFRLGDFLTIDDERGLGGF